ncbi:MAG: sterol desaturase family protein [Candidatus Binataceae bacterium]
MSSGAAPIEKSLSREKRERIRAQALAETPQWYNPYLHLAVPSLVSIALIAAAVSGLQNIEWWELLAVPVAWIFINAIEWSIHRDLMHRWHPLTQSAYAHHTPEHHMIYVNDDMWIHAPREIRLVLIRAFGLLQLAVLLLLPITALLWIAGFRNVALLYLATATAYLTCYEWLHLACHFPADSRIAGFGPLRILRRNHAIHHDPRLMQRCNFNVTLPFWDWAMGTFMGDQEQALALVRAGQVAHRE